MTDRTKDATNKVKGHKLPADYPCVLCGMKTTGRWWDGDGNRVALCEDCCQGVVRSKVL